MATRTFPRLRTLIGCALAISIALPAIAATQDEFFWKELQRSDGSQEPFPLPRAAAPARQEEPAAGSDWFAAERQKTDGYAAERDARDACTAGTALPRKRNVAAKGADSR